MEPFAGNLGTILVELTLKESFQQRVSTEGWRRTLIAPAFYCMIFWGGIFLVFERIGAARHGFSGWTLAFAIWMAFITGSLSAIARASWGRVLEVNESGNVRVLGQRGIAAISAKLADMPALEIIESEGSDTIMISLRFPSRTGEKQILFTTRCDESEKQKLHEIIEGQR